MAEYMADFMEEFALFREAAVGYRKQLEEDGWSPTAAEMIAASWLIEMQRKALNP
jgi:hypothetical protein